MKSIVEWLKDMFTSQAAKEESAARLEELRISFRARYHNFKAILSSNNKALEVMSEIEKALAGGSPFGMSFIRSSSTAVSVNVFRMIQHIDQMVPDKYSELFGSFESIQERVTATLTKRELPQGDKLVIPLSSIDRNLADQVGSKMANIGEIRNEIDLPVPPGFVITAEAYRVFVEHNDLQVEIDRLIQATETSSIEDLYHLSTTLEQLIIDAPVPDELEKAILDGYSELQREAGAGSKVSLRSSALGEDASGTSFAGQFRTVLNVAPQDIIKVYKQVVAGKYGLPAITYRLNRGIPDEAVAMCVGCMAMVQAMAGGVMYTRNPMNIRDRSVLINSVWGLPKAVVDGSVDPDVFVVSRTTPMEVVQKKITPKDQQMVYFPEEGVSRMVPVDGKRDRPSITDVQAVELAGMAVKLDAYYGYPQDIEWAMTESGVVLILQCRPLQQMETREADLPAAQHTAVGVQPLLAGGMTASPGAAFGDVFIVRNDDDRLRFPDGAVLVAAQALPRWAPLLGRAAAVVTEVGSVAGHLANVAREFGIPALLGVTGAMERFTEGQTVTVDAEGRTVYPGRIEELLARAEPRKNLMEGSPVYETLRQVSAHIIPLNLLDPEAPGFNPENCRTFHDITRFIHEKCVFEMFNFGKEHHFEERSSKQLVCEVPMQWWILNLGDGFKEELPGKFVQLDNILCVPMLAMWEGITAIPWMGPPELDAKGFLSVLVHSSSSPMLDVTMSSPFSARNYFMIARDFCSLSSRFGFHFSTLEALVGDNPVENYISFVFKGGAADHIRRVKRAMLIKDVMERYGFRAELKEDGLFGRMENSDEEFMKSRLRILGYLVMHTRQLDMVMSDQNQVSRYHAKFLEDIDSILAGPTVQSPLTPAEGVEDVGAGTTAGQS